MITQLPFEGRTAAGLLLAKNLTALKNAPDTIILALVRGGVVVGSALAKGLSLPMFPYIVRKLGHPSHREFALGAIAEGGATYLDETSMKLHGVEWGDMEEIIDEEMKELARRKTAYMIKGRPSLKGKTIILTDDGAATGSSLFAAIEDLREAGAKKIISAIPVCPPDAAVKIREKSDEAVILSVPEDFYAVGQFYEDFPQVSDEEVIEFLKS